VGFNPRARVGRDEIVALQDIERAGFNPRARVGRDKVIDKTLARLEKFQSTRPRGARLERYIRVHTERWFQSTRPRGARHIYSERFVDTVDVSIHAPAWGATTLTFDTLGKWISFNPRARVGRDVCLSWMFSDGGRFNPRARVGRDARPEAVLRII